MLETAGATRIITMDLHADQIQGFFEKPIDHLFASTIFVPYIKVYNSIISPSLHLTWAALNALMPILSFEKRCGNLLQTTPKKRM